MDMHFRITTLFASLIAAFFVTVTPVTAAHSASNLCDLYRQGRITIYNPSNCMAPIEQIGQRDEAL